MLGLLCACGRVLLGLSVCVGGGGVGVVFMRPELEFPPILSTFYERECRVDWPARFGRGLVGFDRW